MKLLGALVLLVPALAAAAPSRVLVADDDPELLHALESSLAPWRLAVVSDPAADDEPSKIAERAARAEAQFVVWRDRGELVVFDRERGTTERRRANEGRLDPVDAAAAALTVKTLMRLPPPPVEGAIAPPPRMAALGARSAPAPLVATARPDPARWHVRVHVAGGGHATGDATAAIGQLGVMVRAASWPLRVGVVAHGTTSASVAASGFKGSWHEHGALAIASWSTEPAALPSLSIEPWLALGAVRGHLAGTDGMTARDEQPWLPALAGGAAAWWVPGTFRVGALVGLEARGGTTSYYKKTSGQGQPLVFAEQPFALTVGIVVGAELGL